MAEVLPWRGSTEEVVAALDRLQISGSCEAREESIPLALRNDYEEAFRVAGLLSNAQRLADDPALAAAAQADWHSMGSNGCRFAAFLSGERLGYGWDTHIVRGTRDSRDLANAVADVYQTHREDPVIEVVSVLLPELDDEALLGAMLTRLAGLTEWDVRLQGEEVDEALGPIVRLGVRAAVEFDHWSEVLGFGCFVAQANTRLAPFTELAIRAKPPKTHRPNQRAYMADIDMEFERDQVREWWRETQEDRLRRLSAAQEYRGKAKVTFSLRQDSWRRS